MSRRFLLTLAAIALGVGLVGTSLPASADNDDNRRQQWRDFRNGQGGGNGQQFRDYMRQQRQNFANNGGSNWGGFGNNAGGSWRERLANMSPEDRQQLRKKFRKHKRRMANQMGGFGGGGCNQGGGFGGFGGGNGGGFLGGNGGGFFGGNGGGFFGGNNQMGNLPPGLQNNFNRMQNGNFPGQGNGLRGMFGL